MKPDTTISPTDRLIFALDVPTVKKAQEWIYLLQDEVKFYKVGLQLFLAGGFDIVQWIIDRGHRVMLDLKFYDIPQTVQLALEQLDGKGITFATVHGNRPVLKAATCARTDVNILAVTFLTSFGKSDLEELGSPMTVEELVLLRAKQAVQSGCAGIVASGREARLLREKLGYSFYIVTPGIRPKNEVNISGDDQNRTMSAEDAIAGGADFIVVGRPISRSKDPISTVLTIKKEIEKGLSRRKD